MQRGSAAGPHPAHTAGAACVMTGTILVVNSGSSSVKFTLYDYRDERLAVRYDGQVDGIGTAPHFVATNHQGQIVNDTRWDVPSTETSHYIALRQLGTWLRANLDEASLLGVGHRVVHGGPKYSAPVVITEPVLTDLESLIPLAPLHQPHNLVAIRGLADALPEVPQVACFDTAFHRGHSPVVDRFALPEEFYDAGVRRYGLLGISGLSSDMRALLASDNPQAALAIDYFVYRVVRELGGMAAALSGVDALVFTAGIGEHAAALRARICRGVAWLGLKLDEAANQRNGPL